MKTSRRDFMRMSGAAGLFTAAGCAGFPAITSRRCPNGVLRHACIGVGNKGRDDWKCLMTHPKIEIAALCDVDANFLKAAKAAFPNARVYTDWRELFAAEGDRIDSVNISTPDHNHTIIADAAMRAGKHVYLQKPLCKTLRESEYLRTLAAKTGVVTQMGAQFNASLSDRQTVEILRSGTLGPVEKAYFFSTRKGLSRNRRYLPPAEKAPDSLNWDLWLGVAAERPYAPKVYHPLIWRVWHDFGGGWIGDIGTHLMSAVWRGMDLGTLAPTDVWMEKLTDAEDNVKDIVWPTATHISWNMPAVKATGGKSIKFDWYDGCSEPDELADAKFRPPAEIDALFAKTPYGKRGHEGKAIKCRDGWILELHNNEHAYVVRTDGSVTEAPDVGKVPTHYHEYVDSCRAGRKATADFSWSTHMMELILTGEIAERLPGRLLKWDRAAGKFAGAPDANAFLTRTYRKGWEIPGLS